MATSWIIKLDPSNPKVKDLEFAIDPKTSSFIRCSELESKGQFLFCTYFDCFTKKNARVIVPADTVLGIRENDESSA